MKNIFILSTLIFMVFSCLENVDKQKINESKKQEISIKRDKINTENISKGAEEKQEKYFAEIYTKHEYYRAIKDDTTFTKIDNLPLNKVAFEEEIYGGYYNGYPEVHNFYNKNRELLAKRIVNAQGENVIHRNSLYDADGKLKKGEVFYEVNNRLVTD